MAVGAHEHRDVAGLAPAVPSDRRRSTATSSVDEVGGEVLGDVLARRGVAARSRCGVSSIVGVVAVARPGTAAARPGAPAAAAPVARGAHRAVDDPLVPELGAAEQRVVGVDQGLVAAPVDLERRLASPAARAASR